MESNSKIENEVLCKTDNPEMSSTNKNLISMQTFSKEEKLLATENKKLLLKEKKRQQKLEDKEATELRYKRLMTILSKSQFYSNFLSSKISDHKVIAPSKSKKQKTSKTNNKENYGAGMNSDLNNAKSSKSMCKENDNKEPKVPTIKLAEKLDQPKLFQNGTLRSYQLEGYSWLTIMYENGINGILADEMGLGKTVQTIALICHLIEMKIPGPFLIVAPLSTLPNWIYDFERFAPQVPTLLYHGDKHQRTEMRNQFSVKKRVPLCNVNVFPVVITSYEVIIRDTKILNDLDWKYLTVDEGHRIKNSNCQLARCLRSFRTTKRLLLTGTPLQNDLGELWSLLHFILPEIFDSLAAFESWFDITDMMDEGAEDRILQQEKEKNIISTMHKILNPFLLRRVKQDVELDIPLKKELLVYAPMTPLQLELYKATITKDHSLFKKEETKLIYDSNGRPLRNKKNQNYSSYFDDEVFEKSLEEGQPMKEASLTDEFEETVKKTCVLNLTWRNTMMQCRKIVNHPYLLRYPLTPEGEYKIDNELLQHCGKLQLLDQLLEELNSRGHKVLIFSQMAKVLDIIEDYLTMRPQYNYKRLDGKVKLEDRSVDINEFNSNENIFLYMLTTRAGGLGINLTSADTVIIYDSDWNPQQDLQAQDRCHRIGQTKPVLVLRFVTASTIDEKIVERASTKRKLEKLIIKNGQFKSSVLQKRNLQDMITSEELLELLNQADHSRIIKATTQGAVFTKKELNQLLDRKDASVGKKLSNNDLEGVYKII